MRKIDLNGLSFEIFDNEVEAAIARDKAAEQYFDEFVVLNIPITADRDGS